MEKALELFSISKTYPRFELSDLSLGLEMGRSMAFIGNNGAGKTTTMRMIAGISRPDSGSINIYGKHADFNESDWKYDIGYVPDNPVFYDKWSVERNLKSFSKFFPNWNFKLQEDLTKRFELDAKQTVTDLSSGNRTKLSLIIAMAKSPKLLLLDEPTSGLDPIVRRELLDVLFEFLTNEERAIFYSTHILSEVDRLADDIAFIKDGRLISVQAKEDLLETYKIVEYKHGSSGANNVYSFLSKPSAASVFAYTDNLEQTVASIANAGGEVCSVSPMPFEDITVSILKSQS